MLSNHRAVRVALTVAVSMAASACGGTAERGAGGPEVSHSHITEDPPNAVTCSSANGKPIGDAGGTVALPGGHHLHVPKGALSSGAAIDFIIHDLNKTYVGVQVRRVGGGTVTFDPSFPATLRLSYAGCTGPDMDNLGIYIWNDTDKKWNPLPGSKLESNTHSVSVELNSIQSEYAVGAP